MSIKNNPEHLKIAQQAMQEMSNNKAPGQPGAPSVANAPRNPNISTAQPSKEVLAALAKMASKPS